MVAVFLAFDLARVPREHPALAQCRTQRFGRHHQRARDAVAHRIGLRRYAAASDTRDDVVLALGLGDFEGFEYAHPRRVAREIVLERTLVDLNFASARQHADACDRGFAPTGRADDVLFLWHCSRMSLRQSFAGPGVLAGWRCT